MISMAALAVYLMVGVGITAGIEKEKLKLGKAELTDRERLSVIVLWPALVAGRAWVRWTP